MPYMELSLRSSITTFFLVSLILIPPNFTAGGFEALHPEVYEIDYRGPETHASVPPPHHSLVHGKLIGVDHPIPSTKSEALRDDNHLERKAKRTHGRRRI